MAIVEGIQDLKAPGQILRPGIFSDARASDALTRGMKEAEKRVKALKAKLTKALENPTRYDPVYQACQRIFHRSDSLVLTREDKIRHFVRRKAFRRFLHGCPPRKKNDTSIGDAINWEWMVYCAQKHNAELVIVTRDADYGLHFENKSYINDHLKQEFAERVSKKRNLLLYSRLSEALKHFSVPVSAKEETAETEIVESQPIPIAVPAEEPPARTVSWVEILRMAQQLAQKYSAAQQAKSGGAPTDG